MNKILILFILIFQISFSQTKDETIKWLNINLEHYGDNQFMGTFQIELREDENDEEYLLFIKKSTNWLTDKTEYDYYAIKPSYVSLIYLSGKARTNQTLDIFIQSEEFEIYHRDQDEDLDELAIHMKNGNNEMASRIQTGLLHLFEVLGNKIEKPKDLFKN
tara:strand:+ start:659 stop:1141 length:483 start_codon:yes stop_codon:yes gene_type:complete